MNLLVVMANYPFPPRLGSSIIAFNSIKQLSRSHSIHLVCLGEQRHNDVFLDFVEKFEFVPKKKLSFFLRLVRQIYYKIAFGIPILPFGWMISQEMKKRVRGMIERNKFDAILLFEMDALPYIDPKYCGNVIVNIEDPLSIKLGRMRSLFGWFAWLQIPLAFSFLLTVYYERRFLPIMGRVLLLSKADEQELRVQSGYDNLGYMAYGIAKQRLINVAYDQRTDGMIIFSGSMYHHPNVDGIVFFLKKIFSLVLQNYPSAILWIVGAKPDKRIRRAAACFREHVVITGKVEDVSAYLQRAKVSICPVRLRIGVQTKILEALSWGTPVVTTSAGNSGICGCSGRELWVEDEPHMFASRVVALLRGKAWHQLSEEGRKLVEERFSWERSAMDLEWHIMHIKEKQCKNVTSAL